MKRKKIKTILCHMAIITICMGVFCHGYIMGIGLSKYDRFNVYGEDNWTSVNQEDLVTAFRYYCKSRNLVIDGSMADAITQFTTKEFNNIVSVLGIDPTQLQAELKKTTGGNLGLRFLFTQTGVNFYNRIFAEFLQNNDLSVGDSVDNEVVYSGKSFTDADGNSCLVYVINYPLMNSAADRPLSIINEYGSLYKYSQTQIANTNPCIFNLTQSQTVSIPIYHNTPNANTSLYCTVNWSNSMSIWNVIYGVWNNNLVDGSFIIRTDSNKQGLVLSTINFYKNNAQADVFSFRDFAYLTNASPDDTNVTIDTPDNTTINNNVYNNNYVIIYNDGDTYISDDDDEPSPTTPPEGGGGGGGGDEPVEWNPTTPNIPNPSSPDFPSIDLPDIDIPDLPSLNFSLGDLRTKFPFSLPFDIIAVLNVLDGEPQAPHIQATVPIGQWYTWEMDFDFAEFDNYARIFRAFEFIGFCIGLAIFTVHFVKG